MPSLDEDLWEAECRRRIRVLICTIYRDGITLSKAQEIMGEYGDGDALVVYMHNEKKLMQKVGSTSVYEYTFSGLKEFYASFLSEIEESLGRRPEPSECILYVKRYVQEILH